MMICLVSCPGSPGWLAVLCWGSALVPYFPGVGWACAGAPTSNPVPPPAHCRCRATPSRKPQLTGCCEFTEARPSPGGMHQMPGRSAQPFCFTHLPTRWHSTQRCPSVPGITATRWHGACPLAREPGGSPKIKQGQRTVELLIQAEKK